VARTSLAVQSTDQQTVATGPLDPKVTHLLDRGAFIISRKTKAKIRVHVQQQQPLR